MKMTALEYGKCACDTLMKKFEAPVLPPVGRFHYHQGVFLSGMQKIYEICKDEKYLTYCKDWVDSIINEEGEINTFDQGQLDDIQPGVLLFLLYEKYGEERYKKALDTLLPLILNFPKNVEGGLWHKEQNKEQMWLDGLYMAGPISAQYGATFGHKEYYDLCIFQALLMEKKTKDTKTGLWYHAWDSIKERPWADPETGRSSEFWGRSIGWVPVALLEELEHIPADYKDSKELVRMTLELLEAVVKYQDKESGLWYQVVDKGGMEGNWLESSCTCLFVAAICKAVRMGLLDKNYLTYAKKGYEGVINRIRFDEQGIIIDNICVGTGVGDYKHYCDRPTSENDLHGAGAFIIMCAEVSGIID
ncbi:unsaturated rhamnogalacturonyl hydrolase YteR [Anaerocolumna cellulosilytica]|uniref:Unsaturated rhamnogalacturonyl hydrolase YteR n=1 Tax=Anaerocolumna cellulosilytica TaxID=433286 RepID=A0A6S6QXE0_9FIRM|nr:glycoside hydrolase family 88 protein [Anaerocolumna cellulosilytica]MBB5196113.1 unsaturated rhamnogalacturonyl hydrolase [Anaerocolumna cellulosilytica]BCJ92567.1 unsaturated rhamnogalacturonyl hydrolase YteR [Anaerocolumna cellulosilytica]